jgi:hypothetical protein
MNVHIEFRLQRQTGIFARVESALDEGLGLVVVSRRGYGTQPRVLSLGILKKTVRSEGARDAATK